MTRRSVQMAMAVAATALAAAAVTLQAQRNATAPMQLALKIGNDSLAFSGQGTCQFTTEASIYDLPASMYTARHSDDAGSVNLALWQPRKGGGDMMNLAVTLKGTSHRVSTVKVGQHGSPQGSGTASVTRAGKGGTFRIDATSDSGRRITGTITCGAFTEPIAEGGD